MERRTLSLQTPDLRQKIEFNDLELMKADIAEWSGFSGIMIDIYREMPFATEQAVIGRIARSYNLKRYEGHKGPELFYAIVDDLCQYILKSDDPPVTYREELDYLVSVVVSDAFLKCTVFEKPGEE